MSLISGLRTVTQIEPVSKEKMGEEGDLVEVPYVHWRRHLNQADMAGRSTHQPEAADYCALFCVQARHSFLALLESLTRWFAALERRLRIARAPLEL